MDYEFKANHITRTTVWMYTGIDGVGYQLPFKIYASDGVTVVKTITGSDPAWEASSILITGLTPNTSYIGKLDADPTVTVSFTTLTDDPKIATESQWEDLASRVKSKAVWHGTCPTATATAAKVVTLDDATGFTLADGMVISVAFANSSIDRSATLNVNSTGAKDIIDYTLSDTNTHDGAAIWQSGETVLFSYHSGEDAWERVGGAPTYLSEGGYWDFSVGDVLILSGFVSANSSATTDVQVNFRKTFADPPRVLLTSNFNESGSSFWWAFTTSVTTTSFTFRAGYSSVTGTGGGGNSSAKVSWLAIGRLAGAV